MVAGRRMRSRRFERVLDRQVLYAFKQAGISIHGPMFSRGVDFLLKHQVKDPAGSTTARGRRCTRRPSGRRPSDTRCGR